MSPHELIVLHVVHVAAVLILIGYTFYGFAAPPETKRAVLSISGLAALVVVGTGLRMWQGLYGLAPLGWIVVKLVCWLGIAALGGMGYKRRAQAGLFLAIVLILAVVAVLMVYTKAF
jgi:ABC-type transport system involved in cytochrome c biogenesis permease subunit